MVFLFVCFTKNDNGNILFNLKISRKWYWSINDEICRK